MSEIRKGGVVIGRDALSLMMNCLRRDAEGGNATRAEILQEVEKSLEHYDPERREADNGQDA